MDGFQLLVLAALLVMAGLVVGWWWLVAYPLARARTRSRPAPLAALLALQLFVGLALVSPMLGLGSAWLTLLMPPLGIIEVLSPSPKVAIVMAQNRWAIA